MPPLLQSVVYLRSSEGAILVLKGKEMWIGRGSFELSERGKAFCSRKQAYLKDTNAGVQLECHGLNSIYFLICQAVGFQADVDAALSNLYTLKKGEVVDLTDGDKFFLAPKECLLTVCIKQNTSGQDGTVGEPIEGFEHQNSQNDLHSANQDVGYKSTQNEQDFRICVDEQHKLVPMVETVRATARKLDVLPKVSGQGSLGKTTASENSFLPEVSNNLRSVGLHGTINTTEGLAMPDGPSLACLPTLFLEVAEGAGSSSKVGGGCLNSFKGDIGLISNIVEGRECVRSSCISGEIPSGGFKPCCENFLLGSRDSLNASEIDHNVASRCDDGNGAQMLAFPSEQHQPRETMSSEDVCMLEPEPAQPQRLQPSDSSGLPDFPSPLPNPSIGSENEVPQAFRNPVSFDAHENPRNIQVTSLRRKNQSASSDGLPIMGTRESCVLDDRTISQEQQELVVLMSPKNKVSSLAVAPAQLDEQLDGVRANVSNSCGNGPIEGMGSVTATVSGYDNLVRARLINLINITGAAYTGSLTQSNTHVVCWKFKGPKYELAKKLGKSVINHRWFEDCLKAGKRLPEGPYKSCGEVVEPLLWNGTCRILLNSRDGFVRENILFKEDNSHCQFGPPTIGESSVRATSGSKIAGRSSQPASASRSKFGILDKGKRVAVIDLSSPEDDLGSHNTEMVTHEVEDNNLARMAEAGAVEDLTVSVAHVARQQESDDFWNEVIRVCDTGEQGANHEFFPDVHPSAGLRRRKTRRALQASSFMGSFSGERHQKSDFQMTGGRRDEVSAEACPSGEPQSRGLQDAAQSLSLAREQSGNLHDEDDDMHCSPQILQRKRTDVTGGFSDQSSVKYRRLMRKERVGLSDELFDQEQNSVGITGGTETEVEATLLTHRLQTRGPASDKKDERQQSLGVHQNNVESDFEGEEKDVSVSPPNEIACVICHSDTTPNTEGVLTCGHKFCYPCIQRWADEAQKSKLPTCPLCKVPFDFITFRETSKDGISPQVFEEKVVQLGRQVEQQRGIPSLRTDNLCISCGSTDTPQLLLICTICRERACHTFCLDPPRPPGSSWFCSRCSHAHSRIQVREAYRRIFPGSSQAPAHQIPDVSYVGTHQVVPRSVTNSGGELSGARSSRIPMRRPRQNNLRNYLVRDNNNNV